MGRLHGFGINGKEPVDISESRQRAAELSCQRKALATAHEHYQGTGLPLQLCQSVSSDLVFSQF